MVQAASSSAGLGVPLSIIICVMVAIALFARSRHQTLLSVPTIQAPGGDFRKALNEGYEKAKLNPQWIFQIPTVSSPMTILAPALLDEIRAVSEKKLNFRREMYDRFVGRYTAFASNDSAMVVAIKNKLTPGIDRLLPTMDDEAQFAVRTTLASCGADGWTTVPLHSTATRLIALLSGRVFVGLPLSRNEEWIDAAVNVTQHSIAGAFKLLAYPAWLRPLVRLFVREVGGVEECRQATERMLRPLVEQRLRDMRSGGADFQGQDDMIQWLITHAPPGSVSDVAWHVSQHLVLNIAAIHTTSGQLSGTLFALAARPHYMQPLREEIEACILKHGALTKQCLHDMVKLDSFLREVQRLSPPGLVSVNRKVLEPITLSNGQRLPVGTSIAFPADAINRDPELWERPADFDGFRFARLRTEPGSENSFQFVSSNASGISFGHGKAACPGRWFAATELKVMLARLLPDFDFALAEGGDGPLHAFVDVLGAPDPTRQIRVRRRA
ncbi:cytochrome p450 [Diplodia corticola]|uniref:Cytochrome p450 n=1 Tax=Diplodia corticola TaxID=236234 RepID=A0A1J9R8J5_9PEZI|nr:cytochrome p450 [Diplodia corticola]OJD28723.1 cytochrome p450 [Diplodia corticola]